jgi:hypothetical protein
MRPPLSANLVERYEVLRDHLLQGRWSQALSWRVVVQHGLLAWSQLPPSCPPPLTLPPPLSLGAVPTDLQAPVTQVLASMVLSLYPEVHHEH